MALLQVASIGIQYKKSEIIHELYMETIAIQRYTLEYSYDDGSTVFNFWKPNNYEYTGTVLNHYDDNIDIRMTSSEIRYAQLAFYEIYRYGELSEQTMMNFKFLHERKNTILYSSKRTFIVQNKNGKRVKTLAIFFIKQ